jgi:hypothetical protein
VNLPGEHAVNRFKLIIRNIPKARADDSGSDSKVIAAAIGRAINDGNVGRPPMQIRRSVGWNSGLVQSALSSLVNQVTAGAPVSQLWNGASNGIPTAQVDGTLLMEENGTVWVIFGGNGTISQRR